MGKRSNFERVDRDFYPTPLEAVMPLEKYFGWQSFEFFEPCAGDGQLVNILEGIGHVCVGKWDIEPQADDICKKDALSDFFEAPMIITNPPWNRKTLHPMIERFCAIAPTWLLFDADWMHTKQSTPYMKWCETIVSVGRVKWIPDSKMTGKDNCAWYLFDRNFSGQTTFVGRNFSA